jgi:hypothetical protein
LLRKKRARNKFDNDANQEWLGTAATHTAAVLDSEIDEGEIGHDAQDDDGPPATEVKSLDLSFILHPSHEPSPPNRELVTSLEVSDSRSEDTLRQARALLEMDLAEVERL